MSEFKRRKLDLPKSEDEELIIDFAWLSTVSQDILETLQRNREQRQKFPGEPLRFLDTETALYAQIKALSMTTESPELFTSIELLNTPLEELLQHPNEDLQEQFATTLADFIDHEYEQHQGKFIPWLLRSKILNTLLTRHSLRKIALQMISELCEYESYKSEVQSSFTEDVLVLCGRSNEQGESWDLVEVMYDLIYKLVGIDKGVFLERFPYGVEILLVALSKMTKVEYTTECEPIEDIVDALALCLTTKKGYELFHHYEGFELLLLIMKNDDWGLRTFLKLGGLVMDSLNQRSNVDFATSIVKSNYFLKNTFKHFSGNEKMIIHMFVSLMVFLPFGSDERMRVINRLMTKNAKGLKSIIKLAQRIDRDVADMSGSYDFDDLYLEKIEAGLDVLQSIMLLLAWLLIEDDCLKSELLSQGVDIGSLRAVLNGYEAELVFNYENAEDDGKDDIFEMLTMTRELLANLEE